MVFLCRAVTHQSTLFRFGFHACFVVHHYSDEVETFIAGLFDQTKELKDYKQHLRDFLVSLREFKYEDNSELYREEQVRLLGASALALPLV